MTCTVLGTEYKIEMVAYKDDAEVEKRGICGYQDPIAKRIVVCCADTHPNSADEAEPYQRQLERECLRHELVHAFLEESGLSASSLQSSEGWAKNEEMVDCAALHPVQSNAGNPACLRADEQAQLSRTDWGYAWQGAKGQSDLPGPKHLER